MLRVLTSSAAARVNVHMGSEHLYSCSRSERAGLPASPILYNLRQSMSAARELWPQALSESPMAEPHKEALRAHWRALQPDLRIEA